MITVTKEDLVKFIKAQKNNRPVNMNDYSSTHPCGCVMVHFANNRKFGLVICGVNGWYGAISDAFVAYLEKGLTLNDIIYQGAENRSKTYGELKKQLVP